MGRRRISVVGAWVAFGEEIGFEEVCGGLAFVYIMLFVVA